MIKFLNLKDSQNTQLFGMPILDEIYAANLSENTESSVVVPAGADGCIISATGNFIVSHKTGLEYPSTENFERVDNFLNYGIIQLENIYRQSNFVKPTNLYFKAPQQTLVYIGFFGIR